MNSPTSVNVSQIFRPPVTLDFLDSLTVPEIDDFSPDLGEKCGVAAVVINPATKAELGRNDNFAAKLNFGFAERLQHRGKHSAGFSIETNKGKIRVDSWKGKVAEFNSAVLDSPDFITNIGIAHTRYSITGSARNPLNRQPMLGTVIIGGKKVNIALAHNGNLTNDAELRTFLKNNNYQISGTSDSATVLALCEFISKKINFETPGELIHTVTQALKGSYSFVFQFPGCVVAARDPHGNRPFHFATDRKGSYFLFSETAAAQNIELPGFNLKSLWFGEIHPGEVVTFKAGKSPVWSSGISTMPDKTAFCSLEKIYKERYNSAVPGAVHATSRFVKMGYRKLYKITALKTYKSLRIRIGRALANQEQALLSEAFAVIPIPNSGIPYAEGIAKQLSIQNLKLIINTHIDDRSFQGESELEQGTIAQTKYLLNSDCIEHLLKTYKDGLKGKTLIFADDSVIRGTTLDALSRIFKILKSKYGVAKIIVISAFPEVRHGCSLGMAIEPDGKFFTKDVYPKLSRNTNYYRERFGIDALAHIDETLLTATIEKFILAGNKGKSKVGTQRRGLCFGCVSSHYPNVRFDDEHRGLAYLINELEAHRVKKA